MSVQSCAVLFVGAEPGMREFNSGFHGADTRPGTVSQPLASLVCVITAPFSSRSCFCGVASKRLMGWKKTLAQRYGSCSPLCFCLFECAALTLFSPLSLHPCSAPSSEITACVVVWGRRLKDVLFTCDVRLAAKYKGDATTWLEFCTKNETFYMKQSNPNNKNNQFHCALCNRKLTKHQSKITPMWGVIWEGYNLRQGYIKCVRSLTPQACPRIVQTPQGANTCCKPSGYYLVLYQIDAKIFF